MVRGALKTTEEGLYWGAYNCDSYQYINEVRLDHARQMLLETDKPIGTIALFLFRFGWAKPVPVNSFNFKSPRRDMMYVGLAGPLSNFLLASVVALVFCPSRFSTTAAQLSGNMRLLFRGLF